MKTPIGKPMETFNQISTELQNVARRFLSYGTGKGKENREKEHLKKKRDKESKTEEEAENVLGEPRKLSPSEDWLRVRMLLDFFEHLERLIFYVTENGTCLPLCNPVRNFFVTNMSSCQEWLSRAYVPAMVVAYFNGSFAQVIRFGWSAFADVEKKLQRALQVQEKKRAKDKENEAEAGNNHEEANEKEKEKEAEQTATTPNGTTKNDKDKKIPNQVQVIALWMGRAMVELENEQAIIGLMEWCKRIYNLSEVPKFLEALQSMAAGRYELALLMLNSAYTEADLGDSIKSVIRDMILDCCTHLRLPELLQSDISPMELFAWRHLVNVEGEPCHESDADAINRVRQLTVFGKNERTLTGAKRVTSDLVSCSTRELHRWESILTLTLRRTDVLQMQEDMNDLARMVIIADGGNRTHGRLALVNLISNNVLKKMQKKTNGELANTESILTELDPLFVVSKESNRDRDIVERMRFSRAMILWAERLVPDHLVMRPDIIIESAKLARKTGNIILAKNYLKQASNSIIALQQKQLDQQEFHPACVQLQILTQNAKMLWETSPSERPMNVVSAFNTLAATYNIAQQLKHMVDVEMNNASLDMGKSVVVKKLNEHVCGTNLQLAKTCIRLAEWTEQLPSLQMPREFAVTRFWGDLQACSNDIGGNLPGSLLYLATQMCPELAKGQLQFGEWCLRAAAELYSEQKKAEFVQQYRVLITDLTAMDALWECLKNSTSLEQLSHEVANNVKYDSAVTNLLVSQDSALVTKWVGNRSMLRLYYMQAVTAFYRYLAQSDMIIKGNINTLSTTLRILELLVKESEMLSQSIVENMHTTNVHLWKDILPQLLARLSHPSTKVRAPIMLLLSRICQAAPHAIVYQIVSGASSAYAMDAQPNAAAVLTPEDGAGPENKLAAAQTQRNLMTSSCCELETYLTMSYPKLVKDVEDFITQLQRVSLLNEEKWAFVLANLDHEMDRRLEQIRVETAKTRSFEFMDEEMREEIIRHKQRLFTQQVYTVINDLYAKTFEKSSPLTNNESSFLEECGHLLTNAIEASRSAAASGGGPEKAWIPFKQVLIKLQQRISRRGAYTLQINDISEYLSKLHKTTIPMPGQEMLDFSEIVTISQITKNAFVLPTKTRPKKLLILGSDGSEQTFLFKSREDLHLDERIMQLLEISNQILSSGKMKREYPAYFARHYSVTPFGGRCGLIQWVKGATPLFHIYRKWQSRQASLKTDSKQTRQGAQETERPTDMYQKRLRAAFIENNVENEILVDRSKWPVQILKDVLKQLVDDTPNNLISRELWIRSGTCDTWWTVTQRFARSCAVMSMIGAILGIGDRHLDNLLVNLATGELVHIDYNICFDKACNFQMNFFLKSKNKLKYCFQGKNLRVPETVPFRLTQNIVHALGPTQIEGTYRNSCSRVLQALRARSQVLSTILDAFVYDPLVDWTNLPTSGSSAEAFTALFSSGIGIAINLAVYGTMDIHQQLPFDIAKEMLNVKIRELGQPWMANCSDLSCALEDVLVALKLQPPNQEDRVKAGQRLKSALSKHHQMMKEFRPMLRILAVKDDHVVNYLSCYRRLFSEPIIRGHQQLELVQESNLPLAKCPPEFTAAAESLKGLCQCLLLLDKPTSSIPPELQPTLLPLITSSEQGVKSFGIFIWKE
ncbi:hypothetical protein WR25_25021 isoform S [Diploscapter pachys]|nr:hypothetical protein WR25_25021 isoform E [Diploscapter pachys]PAV67190.1 hypothetical protein WR25_25021 isoform F [Diploscapter pachys]PAV67196.1 hypothetical protein WR25_25021 isoform L [Diploscapter pachys]PAV67200.1 hypothetical protein WR25_25021 isoform P [Diploscapter pachys]PAV67203.1 hypothetical protein WR25_25021 isoform S [Diploscapter pachys]